MEGIEALRGEVKTLSRLDKQFDNTPDGFSSQVDFIRGHEGKAGEIYFRLLAKILHLKPGDFRFF